MNCHECQTVFDNLLVAEPSTLEQTALAEHVAACPACARQYAQARRALAAVSVMESFPVSSHLKARITNAISEARVPQPPLPLAIRDRRIGPWKIAAAFALAAALLVGLVPLLWPGRTQSRPSAFGLLTEACAAEEDLFTGNQIVHLLREIVVLPTADKALAQMRWLPLMSLDATGKPRFNQLTLSAEVDKGYTVEDESWYDPATGRFARVLSDGGKPIFANSYDGKNVYLEESPAAGPPQIVSQAIAEAFQAPKSPAEFLGFATVLRSGFDNESKSLVIDVGKTTLGDGAEARVVKLGFPKFDAKGAMDTYWLMTIRSADNTLVKSEWFAQGKPVLVVRRGKAKPDKGPSMGWDLAGIAKLLPGAPATAGPGIRLGMVVLDVSVEHMVKKADYKTYLFSEAPSWAGDREITDCLDVATPPHRMFITTYRAKDSRHVVFLQSFTINDGGPKLAAMGKLIYTSPTGIKVWSGPKDGELAKILLLSAMYSIKDPPGKELTGYLLETPAGTFPALAINGKVSEEEFHSLIDSLVPAEQARVESANRQRRLFNAAVSLRPGLSRRR